MARSATMTTTASAPMAADPSMPAASVAAVAAAAVAGRTRGAGRPPGSTGAAPCPPPGGPSRARGTSLRPTQDTCTATAGTGLRTRSAPTRRRRGCRRARTPTRAPGSPSGSAATTPWIGSASEAGPTGAVGAGAGAEAVAIGRATLRGGRPEGEAAPGSVAARAGGSPRLGNVSLRRDGVGDPCCCGGPGRGRVALRGRKPWEGTRFPPRWQWESRSGNGEGSSKANPGGWPGQPALLKERLLGSRITAVAWLAAWPIRRV